MNRINRIIRNVAVMMTCCLSAVTAQPQEVKQCLTANSPVGTARGIYPGRVVWSHAPGAATWDGGKDFWFADKYNDQESCHWLIGNTITTLTGKKTEKKAWQAIFAYYNKHQMEHGSLQRRMALLTVGKYGPRSH